MSRLGGDRPAVHGGREDGAVAILVAVFALVMFGFAAIIVDLGAARVTSSRAQGAADASALAAIGVLYTASSGPDFDAAVAAAKEYALANYDTTDAEWAVCTDAGQLAHVPDTPCISFDDQVDPDRVRVRIPPRTVQSFFGGIVGYDGMSVAALAEAAVERPTVTPDCVFCMLGTSTHDIGNGALSVSGGDIKANGNLWLDSGSVQTTGTVHVQGTINRPWQVSNPKLYQTGSLTADPLASLAVPPAATSSLPPRSASAMCGTGPGNGPGRYGAVSLGDGPTCVLKPGLYVFTGALTVGGTRGLDASAGVTLFFTCGSNGFLAPCGSDVDPGRLTVTGSGDVQVVAATASSPPGGAVKGMAVLFDRDNASDLLIGGGGANSRIVGTIYGRSATVEVRVPACLAPQPLRSLVVVSDVYAPPVPGQDGCLRTSYAAAENASVTTVGSGGLVR